MNWPEIAVLVEVDATLGGPIDQDLLKRAVQEAALAAREDGNKVAIQPDHRLEVSLYLTDDDGIRKLNREFRGVDRPTDVLSFSLVHEDPGPQFRLDTDAPLALGDIVLSHPYATRQAAELGHSVRTELAWLAIHGMLQLLGYGHDTETTAVHMESLEHRALGALGLAVE